MTGASSSSSSQSTCTPVLPPSSKAERSASTVEEVPTRGSPGSSGQWKNLRRPATAQEWQVQRSQQCRGTRCGRCSLRQRHGDAGKLARTSRYYASARTHLIKPGRSCGSSLSRTPAEERRWGANECVVSADPNDGRFLQLGESSFRAMTLSSRRVSPSCRSGLARMVQTVTTRGGRRMRCKSDGSAGHSCTVRELQPLDPPPPNGPSNNGADPSCRNLVRFQVRAPWAIRQRALRCAPDECRSIHQ